MLNTQAQHALLTTGGLHDGSKNIKKHKDQAIGVDVGINSFCVLSYKTCCASGSIKPELSLKERQFICEVCGFTIDRDENAARNLEYLFTLL